MDPYKLLRKYFKKKKFYDEVVTHSEHVRVKALQIAKQFKHLNPDLKFIEEASLLHDIGCSQVETYGGKHPYMDHLKLGFNILKKEGFPKHARVCLVHTGIFKENILKNNYNLPMRDCIPVTFEEKIIYLADKFFTKSNPKKTRTISEIRKFLKTWSEGQVELFNSVLLELKQ